MASWELRSDFFYFLNLEQALFCLACSKLIQHSDLASIVALSFALCTNKLKVFAASTLFCVGGGREGGREGRREGRGRVEGSERS